jgi:hypothetical protein
VGEDAQEGDDFEREFVNSAGLLLAGTDPTGWGGVIAGFGDQRELELLVEARASTLHIHALDNAKQPPFSADLIAIGQAPDANRLLGGFLPATIIVKQELLSGVPFQSAAADARSKTGVTVTFFQDASLAEYGMTMPANS